MVISEAELASALDCLQQQGRITVASDPRGNPIITLCNWHRYQSEYQRQRAYRAANKEGYKEGYKESYKESYKDSYNGKHEEVHTKLQRKTRRSNTIEEEEEGEVEVEGEGEAEEEEESSKAASPDGDAQPHQPQRIPKRKKTRLTARQVQALYNEHCPSLRKCVALDSERERKIRALTAQFDERWFVALFDRAERAAFCRGAGNGRPWDLTRVLRHYAGILEGKYDHIFSASGRSGESLPPGMTPTLKRNLENIKAAMDMIGPAAAGADEKESGK